MRKPSLYWPLTFAPKQPRGQNLKIAESMISIKYILSPYTYVISWNILNIQLNKYNITNTPFFAASADLF